MAPRVEGPHITAFYANGTASDAVYGPGDHLTLRFSRATDRAPALLAAAGSLPQAAVPRLLACKVDVGGEERAVPLGAVTGEWLADDLLQLTVQGTAGAAPALLVRGAPSAVGVGVLKCCVLKAANLMDKVTLTLPLTLTLSLTLTLTLTLTLPLPLPLTRAGCRCPWIAALPCSRATGARYPDRA